MKATVLPIHKMYGCFCHETCDPGDEFMNRQPFDGHFVKGKKIHCGRSSPHLVQYTDMCFVLSEHRALCRIGGPGWNGIVGVTCTKLDSLLLQMC